LALLLVAASPAPAQEQPSFVVTTDTAQYCAQLGREIVSRQSRAADLPHVEVQRLLAEGRDMCARGAIRGGIARLRRALVILHHRSAPGP
jgi:hypothetical protein